MDIEKAMKNPGKVFGSPEALQASKELTPDEKRAILKQWKDQLQQLQAADDENMPGPDTSSDVNADTLRRVSETLSKLEAEPGSASAPY